METHKSFVNWKWIIRKTNWAVEKWFQTGYDAVSRMQQDKAWCLRLTYQYDTPQWRFTIQKWRTETQDQGVGGRDTETKRWYLRFVVGDHWWINA